MQTGKKNKMKKLILITGKSLSNNFEWQKTFGSSASEIKTKCLMMETKRIALIVNVVLFLFISLGLLSGQAKAASFMVNLGTDASDVNMGNGVCDSDAATAGSQCTLRAAIQESNALAGGDAILISNAVTTINVTLSDLFVTGDVSIIGNGARNTVVQRAAGAPNFRVFYITAPGATVDIINLTVANGSLGANDGGGAGILNSSGTATVNLNGVTVRNNTSAALGGGIQNVGTLNIINSTVSNNTGLQGGGINSNSGTLKISNSTVSDNTATDGGVMTNASKVGGGILNFSVMILNNVTVSNNTVIGGQGGGVYNNSLQECSIRNTIIAGNTVSVAFPALNNPDFGGGAATSQGNNLIGISEDADGFTNGVNGDKVGTFAAPINAQLGALQDNGGQTNTRALLMGSPAIDAGNNCVVTAACSAANPLQALTTDQRGAGFSRQLDGDGNGTATVDIGAFEKIFTVTAAETIVGGRIKNAKGGGIKNVRVIITFPNGKTQTTLSDANGNYSFSDVTAGETCIFSVSAKHYTFVNNAQVINIAEDTQDIDFIAESSTRFIN